MADPLQILLRLRRLAMDQARRGLADCLRSEAEASQAVHEIAAAIDRETNTVCETVGDDRMVDNYAAWLRRARIEQGNAANALLTAEAHTQEARAVLTVGRAAVETVEALIARREAERTVVAERQEQNVLDEAGRKISPYGRETASERRPGGWHAAPGEGRATRTRG
jgi:flagellar export protein FliJ